MKNKLSFLLAFLFLSVASMAQIRNLSPVIKNSKESFTQTQTVSELHFVIKCSSSDISLIKLKAEEITSSAKLTIKEDPFGTFNCTLTITAQNHVEYVQKMMYHLGFETFIFDGKKRSLNDLPIVLKSI